MRLAVLFLVGLGVVSILACNQASPPDAQCIQAQGVCFRSDDPQGCYGPIMGVPCGSGYTCCAVAYGGNIRPDGALFDGPTGAPGAEASVDAATDTGTSKDAAKRDSEASVKDAAHDAVHESSTRDSTTDSTIDSSTHEDATHPEDTGAHEDAAKKEASVPTDSAGSSSKDSGISKDGTTG